MYPTISDLLKDLLGVYIPLPIQSFGFFVAIAFLGAAYIFTIELKRKEALGLVHSMIVKVQKGLPASNSELISSGVFGFILGFKLLFVVMHYGAFAQNPQQFILSMDGSWLGGAIVATAFVWMKYREGQKNKLPEPIWEEEVRHPYQLVPNMTMVAAISGLIGAKIFHNLENMDTFLADPVDALLSFSGLTFFGGLICGAIAVIWYARKNGITTLHLIDACAPGLILGYGLGRIGCQVAGDGDWGIDNLSPKPSWMSFLPDWMWSFNFPHNVVSDGIPIPGCVGPHCMMLPNPVFPTPFYETLMAFLIFGILWAIRKRIKAPGVLFCIYLVFAGVERFFIEKIRVNTMYHIFGHAITQAEIISVVLIVLGGIGIVYFNKKASGQTIVQANQELK